MESTKSKIGTFFQAIDRLNRSGAIKRGKDYKLIEEANGKILYLHLESIYSHYSTLLKEDSLNVTHFLTYLEATPAFIQYKFSQFKWIEPIKDTTNIEHTTNVHAMMLCYDTLKEAFNINLERYRVKDFEAAIIAAGIPIKDIDNMRTTDWFVRKVIGYVNNQKCTWNAEGKCFMKDGTPNPRYNLRFD